MVSPYGEASCLITQEKGTSFATLQCNDTLDIQRVPKKNETAFLLNISATKYRIFKLIFSPENGDPYVNFEYITISVRFLMAEIFVKQNRILDYKILIETEII